MCLSAQRVRQHSGLVAKSQHLTHQVAQSCIDFRVGFTRRECLVQ